VTFIAITAAMSACALDDDGLEVVFSDPASLTCGVFAPMGRATHTSRDGIDGYVLSGRWQWGSGSYNSGYISGGGFVVDDAGVPLTRVDGQIDQRVFFMPDAEVDLLDTWDVAGMQGTGSTDFSVDEVFVPAAMSSPGAVSQRSGQIYAFPTFGFLSIGIAAVALGIAQAALDELVAVATVKVPQGARRTLANRPWAQGEVARAEGQIRSARAFVHEQIERAWAVAAEQRPAPVEIRRDLRLSQTHAVQTCAEAVTSLYTVAGGSSVYRSSPLQRHLRDIHVATQHMMVAHPTYEVAGRLSFDLDTDTTLL
jgi:alkylation response protein AidB-like acyl-CoA dehydrogenase